MPVARINLSEARLKEIEDQIKESSIPYDYDTKEYPIEVIVLKFSPKDGTGPTMFIPRYQRDFVWDNKRRCKFIESLFLGVPVPPIFVAITDEEGTLELIDGSQRIRTIAEYVNNNLMLSELEELNSLNNTRFEDLLPSRRRKFSNLTLRFHAISDKADLAIRADIFDRLNSNVKTLTPAEIRKGAYATNDFYQFVLAQAELPLFKEMAFSTSPLERQELALRFFVYSESYLDFKHEVAVFLNRFIEEKTRSGFDPNDLHNKFLRMLNFVNDHFPSGFRKTASFKTIPRVRFESVSIGTHLALERNPDINPQDFTWLDSLEFQEHTTSDASNSRNKLVNRIEYVRNQLLENG